MSNMRVISGIFRSRKILGYDVLGIRPTMDKVKESTFAMISSYINNSVVLDLFAGTGALGIEALSNGASSVYFVDNSKVSINVIKNNINNLDISDKINIINDDYVNALKRFNNDNIKFDIIFIDPPYGIINIKTVIKKIIDNNILSDKGILVCEYESEDLNDIYETLEMIKFKKYGKTYIRIYMNRK